MRAFKWLWENWAPLTSITANVVFAVLIIAHTFFVPAHEVQAEDTKRMMEGIARNGALIEAMRNGDEGDRWRKKAEMVPWTDALREANPGLVVPKAE